MVPWYVALYAPTLGDGFRYCANIISSGDRIFRLGVVLSWLSLFCSLLDCSYLYLRRAFFWVIPDFDFHIFHFSIFSRAAAAITPLCPLSDVVLCTTFFCDIICVSPLLLLNHDDLDHHFWIIIRYLHD